MKKLASALLVLTLCLTTTAVAADKNVHTETKIDSTSDGYKGTTTYEAVDSTGAKVTSKLEETDSTTSAGKQKSHAKAETSRDPKGLGNKSWAKGETSATVDSDGNLKRETTAKAVDAAGTEYKSNELTKSKLNADGSGETKYTKKIVTDPKGLMNKQTQEIEETTRHAADGSDTKIVKKEIDGKVVEQKVH